MLSAEMLSWILGARRFTSIARICDSRTPVTVTSCSSSVPWPHRPDAAGPGLGFLGVGRWCRRSVLLRSVLRPRVLRRGTRVL